MEIFEFKPSTVGSTGMFINKLHYREVTMRLSYLPRTYDSLKRA